MMVLGLETSCDETAAAVVVRDAEGRGVIRSNVVRSQIEQHRPYLGVVPEIAARAHLELLPAIVAKALAEAEVTLGQIDAVAATAGPGLIGGLMVGLTMGKAMALGAGKPLVAVNHLEAHALTPGLTEGLSPPYLLLLVSGGHTQLLAVEDVGRYRRIATTIDDALGEAFDKTAKLLGLGFPGGPEVERLSRMGDPTRFRLPRPMLGRSEPHFSFAGLKTAVRQQASAAAPLSDQDAADLCAAFEAAVMESVSDRVKRGMALYEELLGEDAARMLVVAGGVAANQRLASALKSLAPSRGYRLSIPPIALCTDNGAMIAWAGAERLARGLTDGFDTAPRARWPLDSAATPVLGSGRLGAKA
ncbi:MAG: tRNA (adenosine(37)-N6)-threonylcarbamoyltransferase complex transferase subunit TsaD [Hyphomicrobiaceae bacterium]